MPARKRTQPPTPGTLANGPSTLATPRESPNARGVATNWESPPTSTLSVLKGHVKKAAKPVKRPAKKAVKFNTTKGHVIITKLTDKEAYEICRRIPSNEEDYGFSEKLCDEFSLAGYLLPKQLPYLHMMALSQLEREGTTNKGSVKFEKRTPFDFSKLKKKKKKGLATREKIKPVCKDTIPIGRKASPKMWYVLAVEPGMDNRVLRSIRRKKKIEGMERFVGRVFSPFQLVEKIVGEDRGKEKRILVKEKKFPGYLLCHLRYNDDVHHLCTSQKGAFGFLPVRLPLDRNASPEEVAEWKDWRPTAVPNEEAAELLIKNQEESKKKRQEKKKATVPYEVGDLVRITTGPMAGIEGPVAAIGPPDNEPKVKVTMSLFGRNVDVEIIWFQAEKVRAKGKK